METFGLSCPALHRTISTRNWFSRRCESCFRNVYICFSTWQESRRTSTAAAEAPDLGHWSCQANEPFNTTNRCREHWSSLHPGEAAGEVFRFWYNEYKKALLTTGTRHDTLREYKQSLLTQRRGFGLYVLPLLSMDSNRLRNNIK